MARISNKETKAILIENFGAIEIDKDIVKIDSDNLYQFIASNPVNHENGGFMTHAGQFIFLTKIENVSVEYNVKDGIFEIDYANQEDEIYNGLIKNAVSSAFYAIRKCGTTRPNVQKLVKEEVAVEEVATKDSSPSLSIEVSDCSKTRRKIGRVYQLPSGNLPKKIRYAKAQEMLARKQCFPSITNVISAKAIDLTGWAKYMMGKHIRENMNNTQNMHQLIAEAQGANDRYTELACNKGTEVHLACEENILSGKEEHDFKFGGEAYYAGYKKFIEDFKPEFLSVETTVYGKTDDGLYYAGTIDFIARINGKIYAGDWKTSKVLHEEVGIQLSAGIHAQKMVNENDELIDFPWEIDGAIGVHLIPDGYSVSKVQDLDYCWETFQALRKVWEWNAFGGNFEKEQLEQINSKEEL